MRRQEFLTVFPVPSGSARWWVDATDVKGIYVDQALASWFGYKAQTLFFPFESPGACPALSQFIHAIQQLMISDDRQASLTCEAMPNGLPGCFRIEMFETSARVDQSSGIYGFLVDISGQVALERQIDLVLSENQRVIELHKSIIEADAAEKARRLLRLEMGFGHTWAVDVESQQVQPDEAFAAWAGAGWQAGQWYPVESMLQSIPEHFHDEFQTLLKTHCQGLAEGQTFSFEHPQIRSDTGQLLWVKVYGKLTTLGDRKQIHGQVIDITEQHDKQNQLEQLIQRQKELFGIVGHELLTPIAALQMHFENIEVDEDARLLVRRALAVTGRMQRIVSDSDPSLVMKVPTRPIEIIQAHVMQLQEKGQGCRLEFDFDGAIECQEFMLNPEDFEQCMSAALTDCVNQAKSNVRVSFSVIQSGMDCQLVVTFKDDRCAQEQGIARSSDVASKTSVDVSFGLLEIEAFVNRLGGTFEVQDSQQGRLMRLAINAQAAPMQAVEGPAPATLLIVEDDSFLTMLIQRMLESAGHKVLSAGNGKEAVQVFESVEFDAVLTDLSMPLMNGHELIRWIREVDSNLPIGVLTASVLGSEVSKAIALGANLALQKPIERDRLLEAIQQLLNSQGSTDLPRNQSQ